jgi:hypothetical protein
MKSSVNAREFFQILVYQTTTTQEQNESNKKRQRKHENTRVRARVGKAKTKGQHIGEIDDKNTLNQCNGKTTQQRKN